MKETEFIEINFNLTPEDFNGTLQLHLNGRMSLILHYFNIFGHTSINYVLCSWKIPSVVNTSKRVGHDTTIWTKQLTVLQTLMLITTGLIQNQN
jgi:hypothetical protein